MLSELEGDCEWMPTNCFVQLCRAGKAKQQEGTFANELLLNDGELLFEAGEVLVERPHKCLVCPEGGLRALFGG